MVFYLRLMDRKFVTFIFCRSCLKDLKSKGKFEMRIVKNEGILMPHYGRIDTEEGL